MAKRKRDYAKRNIGYALQSCDRVMQRLLELQAMFVGHPSNYGTLLEQIAEMQLLVQKNIEKLCIEVWGKVPANLDRWTGTGREYTQRVKAAREIWQNGQDNDNSDMCEMQETIPILNDQTSEHDGAEKTTTAVPKL